MSDLGDWLKQKMDERGLTYNATAVYAGVGQATISDIINKGHVPRVDTLFVLADYFRTPRETVLRLAGILEPADPKGVDPELRAVADELVAIWREVKALDPQSARELMRIVIMQAEMVRAAARSAAKTEKREENANSPDTTPRTVDEHA
jgi:transcriptional regulator with XRE-family HTH domain